MLKGLRKGNQSEQREYSERGTCGGKAVKIENDGKHVNLPTFSRHVNILNHFPCTQAAVMPGLNIHYVGGVSHSPAFPCGKIPY